MLRKINCRQVQAIMPFYLKGKVNPVLSTLIEEHLSECKKCKDLYLKAIDEKNKFDYIDVESTSPEEQFATKEYANFKLKLSAYLDSELEDSENIKIKKMTITNPLARKDLESMYRFKRLLHSSFERTLENFKLDFSQNVMKRLFNKHTNPNNYILKLASGFLFIYAIIAMYVLFH